MGVSTACEMDARANEDISLDVNKAKNAPRPDIDILIEARPSLGENSTEADDRCRRAVLQRHGEKRSTKILPWQSGNESERLRRALDRPIASEHGRSDRVGDQRREHNDECNTAQRLLE